MQAKGAKKGKKDLKSLIKEINKKDEQIEDLSYVLSIIGGASRIKILLLLYEVDELCPGDIGDALDISTPAISQQLRRLREAKLVKHKRRGKQVYYTLSPRAKNYVECLLSPILKGEKSIVHSSIDLF